MLHPRVNVVAALDGNVMGGAGSCPLLLDSTFAHTTSNIICKE